MSVLIFNIKKLYIYDILVIFILLLIVLTLVKSDTDEKMGSLNNINENKLNNEIEISLIKEVQGNQIQKVQGNQINYRGCISFVQMISLSIMLILIVVFKLIKSEDSKLKIYNNNQNEQLNKTKDNKLEVNSTRISFLLNFLTSASNSNKSVLEFQKKNLNNYNNSKKSNNFIMVGELNKNKIIKPSDIQREIIDNNPIEKTIEIKEKRLGTFKRGVLKIPLAFIQMIAISIALLCLLIP
ncbi:hypothetical protein ACTA71_009515 [Dictyostelium dimigraforme]